MGPGLVVPVVDTAYGMITQDRDPPGFGGEEFEEALPGLSRLEEVYGLHDVYANSTDRQLIEIRQARAQAGLDNSDLDVQITRRILDDHLGRGWIGMELAIRGWVNDLQNACHLYYVERRRYSSYWWAGREDTHRRPSR